MKKWNDIQGSLEQVFGSQVDNFRPHQTTRIDYREVKIIRIKRGGRKLILELVFRLSDRGIPMKRTHVLPAAELVVETLPLERQKSLPFRNGQPGKKWLQSFSRRRIKHLQFCTHRIQEGKRFIAANGDTFTDHISSLEAQVREHGFDTKRVWNLDETGVSPG